MADYELKQTCTSAEAKNTIRDAMREIIMEKTDPPWDGIICDIQEYVTDNMIDDGWYNDQDEVEEHFDNEWIYQDFLSTKGNGLDNLGQGLIRSHNSFELKDINAIINEVKEMGCEVDNFKDFEEMISCVISSKAREIWNIIEPFIKRKHELIIYAMLISDDETREQMLKNKMKNKL